MVQRIVYALIIITILALFPVLPGYVVTGGVSNGSQSATVTVLARPAIAPPPIPPPPVYEEGELFIPPPPRRPPRPAPLPPGTTDVSDFVTPAGVFTQRVIINSADGMSQLIFDEGVLGLTKERNPLSEISIIPIEAPLVPCGDSNVIGQIYDFRPDGAIFNPPIIVTFTYDESLIPEGVAEENLVIAMCDTAREQWVPLEVSVVDTETNTVSGIVSHFTPFAILTYTRPPAFTVSSLLITPTEVNIGETVDIVILVANVGGQSGSYELTLRVNGVVEASKEVTLAAGDSELVSFSTIKDTTGTYLLEVAGLTGSFTVGGKPAAPSLPPPTVTIPITPPPSNLPIIGGIIAAVLLAMAGLIYAFLIHRRYKYAAITYPVEVERPVAPPPPKSKRKSKKSG